MDINVLSEEERKLRDCGMFSSVVEYVVDDSDGQIESEEVACWVSNTFKYGFVIISHGTQLYAGGAADNKLAWDKQWNRKSKYYSTGKYELRCSEADLVLFLLKYKTENQK